LSTVQFVAATALSLVVFVALANLVVDLYARGAIRAALDEGVRAEEPIDASASACEQRAADALDALLGGRMRASVRVDCVTVSGLVVARAVVDLHGWIPGITPDWKFVLAARGTKEREP
jgi:hypothetical protein